MFDSEDNYAHRIRLRPFPLLDGGTIPWELAEKAYAVYASEFGRRQSIERIAERGGFDSKEMDMFYPAWRGENR